MPLRGIQPEISESLEKVSVSTIFTKFGKVSVSKNPKLQSRKSLRLDRLRSSVLNEFQYHYLTKSINIHNRKIYQI